MADVAALGLSVDSSDVEKGSRSLDKLTGSAKKAEGAASALGSAYASAGKGVTSGAAAATRALDEQAAAANRAANANARAAAAANDNGFKTGAGNVANIAAQFQDIAVSAQSGMGALQIGLQQGTQLAAVIGAMEKPLQGLGAAFLTVLSPVSLLVIGLTTLAAAGLQMVNWAKLGASALNGLAGILPKIADEVAVAAATFGLLASPVIIGGVVALTAALARLALSAVAAIGAFALANPFTAFVIGATAAVTAAYVFRDELKKTFGVDIVGVAKSAANMVIGAFVGAAQGIVAGWKGVPAALGDLVFQAAGAVNQGVENMLNSIVNRINAFIIQINGMLANLPDWAGGGKGVGTIGPISIGGTGNNPFAGAAGKLTSSVAAAVQGAMGTDYVGAVGGAITKGAAAASKALRSMADDLLKEKDKKRRGKTDAEKYDDVTDAAARRIASLNAERQAIGMTEEAAAKLRAETDLFNIAQQKGLTLTSAQRAELSGLAGQMATLEVETRKAKDAFDFAKDATKGFLSDLRQGLQSGEGLWKSFGNAALNVVNKLADRATSALVDSIFPLLSAGGGGAGGAFGGLLSSVGKLFGFAAGGYTGGGAASRVAGVVHGGEYVFSKKATDRIGVSALDGMHKRAKGYAAGGYVAPAPSAASSFARARSEPVPVQIGVSVDDDGKVIAYVKKQSGMAAQQGAVAGAAVALKQTPRVAMSSVTDNQRRRG